MVKIMGKYRPIRHDINKLQGYVVCGSLTDLVIYHKNYLYNDLRVLYKKTQKIDDFNV